VSARSSVKEVLRAKRLQVVLLYAGAAADEGQHAPATPAARGKPTTAKEKGAEKRAKEKGAITTEREKGGRERGGKESSKGARKERGKGRSRADVDLEVGL